MEAYLSNNQNPVFHNDFLQIIENEDLFSLLQTNASENSQTEFQPTENVALFRPSTALQYKPQMKGNAMESQMYKVSGHEASSQWQNHIQADQPNFFLLQTNASENSETDFQPTENVALFGPSTALQYKPQMEGNVMESRMYKVSGHEASSQWQNHIQADQPNFLLLQTNASENSETDFQPTENVAFFGPSTALQYKPQMEGNVMESRMYKVSGHEASSQWQNNIQEDQPNSFLLQKTASKNPQTEFQPTENVALFGPSTALQYKPQMEGNVMESRMLKVSGHEASSQWKNHIQADQPNYFFECNYSNGVNSELRQEREQEIPFDISFDTRRIATASETILGQDTLTNNFLSQIIDLNQHMRTHSLKKSYQCAVCDRKFSKNKYLTVHMRTHTGEKPYQCDVCNKKFSHKANLTQHMRTHTGEKPYQCDVCKKNFHTRQILLSTCVRIPERSLTSVMFVIQNFHKK
ncbi:protein glass [Trichonephila clavipes]|nr:protein glass [Trichonephila clavipes]